MRIFLHATFSLLLLASCANDIVEEQVDVENGVVVTCGEGDGLNPCIDANGETMAEEMDPNFVKGDSTSEMEKSSAEIRNETPAQLEKTVEALENRD